MGAYERAGRLRREGGVASPHRQPSSIVLQVKTATACLALPPKTKRRGFCANKSKQTKKKKNRIFQRTERRVGGCRRARVALARIHARRFFFSSHPSPPGTALLLGPGDHCGHGLAEFTGTADVPTKSRYLAVASLKACILGAELGRANNTHKSNTAMGCFPFGGNALGVVVAQARTAFGPMREEATHSQPCLPALQKLSKPRRRAQAAIGLS